MDKLCRFLQADPMYSIDDLIRKPKLGFCTNFHVDNYQISNSRSKSLMFFEGTPTNLGCTILLSGGSAHELAIVKSLIRFMVYVAYNSKLEQSFILDKYADFDIKNTIYEHKNDTFTLAEAEKPSEKEKEESPRVSVDAVEKLTAQKHDSHKENSNQIVLKEISVDQSPLEDGSKSDDDTFKEEDKDEKNLDESINGRSSKLRLAICEQHKEKHNSHMNRNFKLLIDDLLLSCSPFITFQMPFLMTENQNDSLRLHLPPSYMSYLQSNILLQDTHGASSSIHASSPVLNSNSLGLNENEDNMHEFLLVHLTKSFDDSDIKRLYADYKSRGGLAANTSTKRLILSQIENDNSSSSSSKKSCASQPKTNGSAVAKLSYDCLDVFNRQHLAVLFYSQCESSPVYPNICHKPRIINMKFYGENDMTLGGFFYFNLWSKKG